MNTHRVVSWALLLYFFLFVIPPISALTALDDDFDAFDVYSVSSNKAGPEIYVVDILVWAQLEESDHQDIFLTGSTDDSRDCGHDVVSYNVEFRSDPKSQVAPFLTYSFAFPLNGHSLSWSSGFRFERSGISPPVLS